MSYITGIGTAVPPHRLDQATIGSFMEQMMQLDEQNKRKLRAVFRASGIDFRHSVLMDYGKTDNFEFYPSSPSSPFPSTDARMNLFRQHALPLSLRAIEDLKNQVNGFDPKSITHLIVVCCTGMYAPGLDIEIIKALSLNTTTERTSITFMGCYAAFNALKVAHAFCSAQQNAKVLVVCTELCSLHFQHTASDDNLLANALFADGSAALLVESQSDQKKKLNITTFHSDLALNGEQDMAWCIGDLGFEMKLTAYIPSIIKGGILELTNRLLTKSSLDLSEIRHFAFHPGGVKILEAIEQSLKIDRSRNQPAYDVLRNYGNMSSPTVLFVLRKLMDDVSINDHQRHILSLAFGPGLTLESMIMQIQNA